MSIELPTDAEPVKVVCEDALSVRRELPDGCVDAVVTDPPFGARRPSARRSAAERFSEIDGNDAVRGDWLPHAHRCLRSRSAAYVFACWDRLEEWRAEMAKAGFRVRSCIVWDKGVHGLGDLKTCWAPQHELILFGAKGRHELRGGRPKDVLRCLRVDAAQLLHPYQKPVPLLRSILAASTDPGDLVVDCFGGSGTTAVAAIHEGRRCLIVERDPTYCDVIRRRVADALGEGKGSLFAREQPSLFPDDTEVA